MGVDAEQSELARKYIKCKGEPYITEGTRLNGEYYIHVSEDEEEYW